MQKIWVNKHPLHMDLKEAEVPAGQTLRQIAGDVPIEAWVDGVQVDAYYIDNITVPEQGNVIVSPVPQGSTEAWRTVAKIAVAVTAITVGTLVGGPLGGMIAYGIVMGGNALIDWLIPLPTTEAKSFNRLSALTGQRNQVGAFQPIPKIYGQMRIHPTIPMTAQPYTELAGGEQYLRMFLCLGYGPLDVGGVEVGEGRSVIDQNTSLTDIPIKIGNTDIHEYDSVRFEIGRPDQMVQYTDQVIETKPNWNTEKEDDGSDLMQTTSPDAETISIDIYGQLYSIDDENNTKSSSVTFKVEYRTHGSTEAWTVVDSDWVISSKKRETVRENKSWNVSKGQYDVRLTRVSTSHSGTEESGEQDSMTWVAFKTIRSTTAFTVPNTICMAIRIKANDKLNGSLDNVSVLATSVLPVWNGTSWVEQSTREPAWAFADVLTGNATRRPISKDKLDVDSLLAWANQTATDGDSFDHVFDDEGTLIDRMQNIISVGRANWTLRDDAKMSVYLEDPDATPKMIISPRNSNGFTYDMASADIPHALRVQFVSSDTWENTERIVYDDGYDEQSAELFETIQAVGCTNPDQAWRLGRYHLAQMRMRPETYSFDQDIQHLRYKKGDLLELQHDVILVGIAAGRIADVTVGISQTQIISDTFLTMETGKNYGMKIQLENGSIIIAGVQNDTPGTSEPILTDEYPSITPDCHFIFGELGKESIDVKVTRIEPQEELKASVVCVPAALDILDSISGTIPTFDPGMTNPIDLDKLPLPVPEIIRIASGDEVLLKDADGSPRLRMLIETDVSGFPGWDQSVQIRYREFDSIHWIRLDSSQKNEQSIFDVESGLTYVVQARSVRNGEASVWCTAIEHTVQGVARTPSDITGFIAQTAKDRVELQWNSIPQPNLEQYEIRTGSDWASGTLLVRTKSTKFQTEGPSTGPWHIKAINTSGVYSANAVTATLVTDNPIVTGLTANVVIDTVTLNWNYSEGDYDVKSFDIYKGVTKIATATGTQISIVESSAGTYSYSVYPVDAGGNVGVHDEVTGVETEVPGTPAPGSVDIANFASSLRPVQIIDDIALPDLPHDDYPEGAVAYLTGNGQLYRSKGDVWTSEIFADDLSGEIQTEQMANDAVTSLKLKDKAVTNSKLGDGSVDEVKIAEQAITSIKLKDRAVTGSKIEDGTITNEKIASGQLKEDKMNWDSHLLF